MKKKFLSLMLTGMIIAGIPVSAFATEQSNELVTLDSIELSDVESSVTVEESSEENFLNSLAAGINLEAFSISNETSSTTTYYSDVETYSATFKLSDL